MAVKSSKVKVPVINADTKEKIGEASESQILGAHLNGNSHAVLKLGKRHYAASYEGDHIKVFPSKDPY